MKTAKELREERRALNRQLRENQMAERRQAAREQRDAERAEMSEDDKKREDELNAAWYWLSRSNSAMWDLVISDLEKRRPVVADMIKERIARHAAASASNKPTE